MALLSPQQFAFGFVASTRPIIHQRNIFPYHDHVRQTHDLRLGRIIKMNDKSPDSRKEEETKEVDTSFIVRGGQGDEFSDEFWKDIEEGKPSEWSVLKEVRVCWRNF